MKGSKEENIPYKARLKHWCIAPQCVSLHVFFYALTLKPLVQELHVRP